MIHITTTSHAKSVAAYARRERSQLLFTFMGWMFARNGAKGQPDLRAAHEC